MICTGRWGFCAIYKHFAGFEFFCFQAESTVRYGGGQRKRLNGCLQTESAVRYGGGQCKRLKLSNKWKKAGKARLRTILIYEETCTIENLQFGFFDSLVRLFLLE